MLKRTYTIAFKKEVLGYIDQGNTLYKAAQYLSSRDNYIYDPSMFYQWEKKQKKILSTSAALKRKIRIEALEQITADEVINLRIQNIKVTRSFIADRARQLADECNVELSASGRWIDGFMSRNNFSLRRTTNLTTLTEIQLFQRAVDYMRYLGSRLPHINISKTVLMDKTAVYFEDSRTQTVDIRGRKHVIMKSTGFSSMRITVALSVYGDGKKAPPLVIHKGKPDKGITCHAGPIFSTKQENAWVNQDLIISWIDTIFTLIDVSKGKCIVCYSCRAHIANKVKEHCRKRSI